MSPFISKNNIINKISKLLWDYSKTLRVDNNAHWIHDIKENNNSINTVYSTELDCKIKNNIDNYVNLFITTTTDTEHVLPECAWCHKSIIYKKHRIYEGSHFCSQLHLKRYVNSGNLLPETRVSKPSSLQHKIKPHCEFCGNVFTQDSFPFYDSIIHKYFCSQEHFKYYFNSGQKTKTEIELSGHKMCLRCGKIVSVGAKMDLSGGVFCNYSCFIEYKDENPNFIDRNQLTSIK